MATRNQYDESFKRSLVNLYRNGRTLSSITEEYGVSISALKRWIMQYSTVELDDGEVLTIRQIKELQKRYARLQEENIILKKANVIFMSHSASV